MTARRRPSLRDEAFRRSVARSGWEFAASLALLLAFAAGASWDGADRPLGPALLLAALGLCLLNLALAWVRARYLPDTGSDARPALRTQEMLLRGRIAVYALMGAHWTVAMLFAAETFISPTGLDALLVALWCGIGAVFALAYGAASETGRERRRTS